MSAIIRSLCAAAIVGAAALGTSAVALADEPLPPNCTAGDFAGVQTNVSAATSAYLLTHPDVNAFFTGLKGQSADQKRDQVQAYMAANPQVQADWNGIRQPLTDFRNHCGLSAPE
jgi:hemophore-related protein